MEKTLAEQLQDVIDALVVAQSKAQLASQTIRDQRLYLGLGLNHPDDEIARLISNMRYTKLLAENKARGATATESDPSPAQEVDGRLVSVSDTGDSLVVNPVQDATALPGVVSPVVEGEMVVSDTVTETGVVPPAIVPPGVSDGAPTVQQVTPDDAGEAPPVAPPDTDGA